MSSINYELIADIGTSALVLIVAVCTGLEAERVARSAFERATQALEAGNALRASCMAEAALLRIAGSWPGTDVAAYAEATLRKMREEERRNETWREAQRRDALGAR